MHCCRTVTNAILELDESLQNVQDTDNIELVVERNDPEIRDPEDVDKDLGEEQEQDDYGGVPKQPKKRKLNTKLSGESILKVFKKNSEERSKLISNILNKPTEQPKEDHPIVTFFQSMAMTVKKFSPENQIRARMEICKIVSQLELEELNQAHTVQHETTSSSTSRDSTALQSLSTQYDSRPSGSRNSSLSVHSPSVLDDDDYDFTLLTNTAGMTFKGQL